MGKTNNDKSTERSEERVPFRMAMGRSTGDDKTDVVEESAKRNESAGGLVSVHDRRV